METTTTDSRPKRTGTGSWVIAVAVAQAIAVAGYLWIEHGRGATAQQPMRAERVEGAAPPLVLRRADGTVFDLSELRGRSVLLHFWASWCAPCRVELPELLAVGRELSAGHSVSVVAAAVDDDWQAIGRFFDGAVPSEVVRVDDAVARQRYEVSTLPDTYLIGADGALRLRFGGARDWRRPDAQALLAEWVGKRDTR
jgi:thiol-disulfide isomerase/thioredoxin